MYAEGLLPAVGLLRIHRAFRRTPLHDFSHLRHRFKRLELDRLWSESAQMRRSNDLTMPGERRTRQLVGRTTDIHGATRDLTGVQSLEQRGFIDQIAPRGINEKCRWLHAGKRPGIHEVFGFFVGYSQAHHIIRLFQ